MFNIKKTREVVSVKDLKPHSKNPKLHNVKLIQKSIDTLGFVDDVVIDENNVILGGHGRIKALKEIGEEAVEVIRVSNWDEKQKEKYLLVANQSTILGGFDDEMIKLFDDETLKFSEMYIDLGINEEDDDTYSKVVESPIYMPSEIPAELDEMFDDKKLKDLLKKINKLDPKDERLKEFLISSAYRFVKFKFDKIADYYARCKSKEVKEIMEDMALVVIDYKKAVELGFVKTFDAITDNLEKEKYEE